MKTLSVQTHGRTEFVDMTGDVQSAVAGMGVQNGLVTVFVPHTTAGITIPDNKLPT